MRNFKFTHGRQIGRTKTQQKFSNLICDPSVEVSTNRISSCSGNRVSDLLPIRSREGKAESLGSSILFLRSHSDVGGLFSHL